MKDRVGDGGRRECSGRWRWIQVEMLVVAWRSNGRGKLDRHFCNHSHHHQHRRRLLLAADPTAIAIELS